MRGCFGDGLDVFILPHRLSMTRFTALIPPFDDDQNVRSGQHDDIWNGVSFIKVTVFILGMLRGWARRFHFAPSAQHDAGNEKTARGGGLFTI